MVDITFKFEQTGGGPRQMTQIKDRKIIQVVVDTDSQDAAGFLIALCDDGTLWGRIQFGGDYEWKEIPTYPDGSDPNKKS